MKYAFGDGDIAAQRLQTVAEIFAESTGPFLLNTVTDHLHLAVDLGCGPGYTTHFLANTLKCHQAIGLDNSEHFISLAQKTKTERTSFLLHDVTCVPFPAEPCDLLYCRFLLTHLTDPPRTIDKWATQLQPKGLLLMEETEWIRTNSPVFALYLEIVEAMLEYQSNKLFVGPVLDTLESSTSLKRKASQVRILQVSNDQAATSFFLNIQSLKHNPFVRKHYLSVLDKLESDLYALMHEPREETEIEWGLRQLVFARID